jgi:hypothetical protein
MADKPPIVFKSEPSLWAMLAECNPDGRSVKPFDMRRWDLSDDRMYRLSWGCVTDKNGIHRPRVDPTFESEVKEVSFLNKATGELLTFEYLGVQFEPWAPGWGFLLLGKRLAPLVEEN